MGTPRRTTQQDVDLFSCSVYSALDLKRSRRMDEEDSWPEDLAVLRLKLRTISLKSRLNLPKQGINP